MDSWDQVLGRTKPAKGERTAATAYIGDDETVLLRCGATTVRQSDDGREVMAGAVTTLVTDRRLILLHSTGGFRPKWSAITLPFGHLEPGTAREAGADVLVPTSGRRGYRVSCTDEATAERFADRLSEALRTYRRERMGLTD